MPGFFSNRTRKQTFSWKLIEVCFRISGQIWAWRKQIQNDNHIYMWSSCERVGLPFNFVSFPELTGRDRRNPMYCRSPRKGLSSEVFWKFCSFVIYFLKNYRQENRKNVTTSNFKLKNTLNHIVLSLLNSMTKTRKEHYFWYFFFKIKRKRTIIFKITLWNRPVSFPFRDMWTNNFLWYTRLWYRDRKW